MANNGPRIGAQAPGAAAANDVAFPKWIVPAGFIVGCAFLMVVLGLVVVIRSPTGAQQTTFTTVLALAGAGYSMSLTGFLSVRLNLPNKGFIVAGGTLAVFIVLFFFPPGGASLTITGDGNTVVLDNEGRVTTGQGGSH
jgi:hypothetical protein